MHTGVDAKTGLDIASHFGMATLGNIATGLDRATGFYIETLDRYTGEGIATC